MTIFIYNICYIIMSSIYKSFLQIAGAIPFSSFLGGGGKRSPSKRTAKRTSKRTAKRTSERTAKRTAKKTVGRFPRTKKVSRKSINRTPKRTVGRTNAKRTVRKVNRRTNAKRTVRKVNRRTNRKTPCSGYYTGNEPSPKGLGYFAHCTPLKVAMKGRDGDIWENRKYSKGKRWVKVSV
jgi:hypothetical protein